MTAEDGYLCDPSWAMLRVKQRMLSCPEDSHSRSNELHRILCAETDQISTLVSMNAVKGAAWEVALTWRHLAAVGLQELDAEGAVLGLGLKAEAGVLVQQDVRIGVVHRVAELLGAARRLVLVQLQQLLRSARRAGSGPFPVSESAERTRIPAGMQPDPGPQVPCDASPIDDQAWSQVVSQQMISDPLPSRGHGENKPSVMMLQAACKRGWEDSAATCARSSASSVWNCFTSLQMSLSSVKST